MDNNEINSLVNDFDKARRIIGYPEGLIALEVLCTIIDERLFKAGITLCRDDFKSKCGF